MATARQALLAQLLAPEHLDIVTGLLISSKEAKIAVPCAVLSKGAGSTAKVVVSTVRSQGANVQLDCGKWWRGAPTTSVWMDYRQLLQHANEDALKSLYRKLVAITSSRDRGLARTQSVPGRILLEEHSGFSGGSSSSRVSSLQRTRSIDLMPSNAAAGGRLRRTSSDAAAQRRTSSSGAATSDGSSQTSGGTVQRTSVSLHRLSEAAMARSPGSTALPPLSTGLCSLARSPSSVGSTPRLALGAAAPQDHPESTSSPALLPALYPAPQMPGRLARAPHLPDHNAFAAGMTCDYDLVTPQKLQAAAATAAKWAADAGEDNAPSPDQPITPLYEDSAAEQRQALGAARLSFESSTDSTAALSGTASDSDVEGTSSMAPQQRQHGRQQAVDAATHYSLEPPALATEDSIESSSNSSTAAVAGGDSPLPTRHLSFSQPSVVAHQAEHQEERQEAAVAAAAPASLAAMAAEKEPEVPTPATVAPAATEPWEPCTAIATQDAEGGSSLSACSGSSLSVDSSGQLRAAQLEEAVHMTMEELHEVNPCFNHVFVPPWAVPAAPPQPEARTFCDAAVQTGTGAADRGLSVRQMHTTEDVADHFEAFMQHFTAGLPHLAMALADLHTQMGGNDPTFVKSQYYFNSLLQLKDEMHQLHEKLQGST